MNRIEELYEKAKTFEELMGSLDFITETKDEYDYSHNLYESYFFEALLN